MQTEKGGENIADKGILTGVEDMTVAEGTEVDFNDLIYMDKTIVKGVDVDDSKVDYTKAGTYEVVYTITFDGEKLRDYIKENVQTICTGTFHQGIQHCICSCSFRGIGK